MPGPESGADPAERAAAGYEPFAWAALASYGLDGASIRLLSHSENATYLVERPDSDPVVLRVHRPGYHSLAAIESELDWMTSVRRDTAIATPQVINALDGRRVVAVRVENSERLADLFTFIPGVVAEDSAVEISYRDLGCLNAMLHCHARSWTPPFGFTRFRWDLDSMLLSERRWGDWRDSPALKRADVAMLEIAERKVIDRLSRYGAGSDRFGLVHADLRTSNLIVQDGHLTLIDFDDCGWGWFMADLAAVVSWIEHTARAVDIAEEWLEGYRKVRPVAAADLAEIPTFIMLRRLMLTAWIRTHPSSEPGRMLGDTFAAGTAEVGRRYVTDPGWFRVVGVASTAV